MPRRNRKRPRKRAKPYVPKIERERGKRKRGRQNEEWSQ